MAECRVLLVEDNADNLALVRFLLERSGYTVIEANNGVRGLELARNELPDLILMDLSLPEMDGWAVASEVHRRWPGVKVVLITGHAVPPEMVASNRELVSEVIFKPIRFDDLSSTMSHVLS